MEYTKKTKWNRDKIESIMNKLELEFESNDNGFYPNVFIKAHERKGNIRVHLYGNTITIDRWGSHWKGIKSYKKFEEVLNYYKNEVSEELLKSYLKTAKFY
jgi:hypothetical protein